MKLGNKTEPINKDLLLVKIGLENNHDDRNVARLKINKNKFQTQECLMEKYQTQEFS